MSATIEKYSVDDVYRLKIFAFAVDLDYPHVEAVDAKTARVVHVAVAHTQGEAVGTLKSFFGLPADDKSSLVDLSQMDAERGCELTGIYFGEIDIEKLYALDHFAKTVFVNFSL